MASLEASTEERLLLLESLFEVSVSHGLRQMAVDLRYMVDMV